MFNIDVLLREGIMVRAKVFISCGQQRDTEEVETAHRIAERLDSDGYEAYIAVEEQTLRGVKENIFSQIMSSEYFLFIDFKRERLETSDLHRGSLFCHQELAIASFLDMPLIAFQENGVKREDGLLGFLQSNSIPFTDRHTLPNVVADTIRLRGWNPNWKNTLVLERDSDQFTDARTTPTGVDARFFHIRVRNLNPYKPACNCYAYVKSIENLQTHEVLALSGKSVELKWAGYVFPNALILPSSFRLVDGIVVIHNQPAQARFNTFTDSTEFITAIYGPGDYVITYIVCSENFPPTEANFMLHLDDSLDDIIFEIIA
jgi:hypothetical protein